MKATYIRMTYIPRFLMMMVHVSLYVIVVGEQNKNVITIATYNLWNVMFHWDIRKFYIATMIRRQAPDIIAFQEVRANHDIRRNQIKELQRLLPEYKYSVYHPVNYVHNLDELHPPGWDWEGLGLLSKHEILSQQIVNLTLGAGPDVNLRALLSVQLSIGNKELSLTNIHMSYDQTEQCNNAMDILSYLYTAGTENSVLVGDFNAATNFEFPVKAIMNGKFPDDSPRKCSKGKIFDLQGFGYGYDDVWTELYPSKNGYTFSNMPSPGLESRPDRILVSRNGLKMVSSSLDGNGDEYGRLYKRALYWHRLYTVFKISQYKALGRKLDYTCQWNCGPHGSCRCGICVKGDDQHTCPLNECFECDPYKLFTAQLIFIFTVALLVYAFLHLTKSMFHTSRRFSSCSFIKDSDVFLLKVNMLSSL